MTRKPDAISERTVVYEVTGMDDVVVRRGMEYRASDDSTLTMDLYCPPDQDAEAPSPLVVFVFGYPDAVMEAMIGCRLKDMATYTSWGRLAAASGLAAITYETRDPALDICELLAYVRRNASSLGVDRDRISIWACSGNVPVALSVLMQETGESLKCAVLYNGFTLDYEGSSSVAEVAERVGFANPCVGRSVDDLPTNIPLFIVRSGQDDVPHLNEAMDHFLAAAVSRNLPTTFINHPDAPHGFDIFDDSEATRGIIQQTLAFMRFHLLH